MSRSIVQAVIDWHVKQGRKHQIGPVANRRDARRQGFTKRRMLTHPMISAYEPLLDGRTILVPQPPGMAVPKRSPMLRTRRARRGW